MTLDYFLSRCRAAVVALLAGQGVSLNTTEVRDVESDVDADLAVPLFRVARQMQTGAPGLAERLASSASLAGSPFRTVAALRGYVNFRFDPAGFARGVFADFGRDPARYGGSESGAGRTIVIDYSSPNIAKPFSVGHLRSTIIGQALKNAFEYSGYRVIGDNHLGDWGTQFGKLLCAYKLWGDESELNRNPTEHLLGLYVRFHDQVRGEPGLELKAREWFRRLETGDDEAREVWQQFVRLSSAEFNRIYELLGVRFDAVLGESFYADRLDEVVRRALDRGVARRETPLQAATGAGEDVAPGETVVIIPLDSAGIDTPLFLQKSDGTSLYATREIAAAEYRIQTWQPAKMLYVVGNEQELYFRQFAAALRLLGHDVPCVHVGFGLIRLPEGRMSTREGRVVLLHDVIAESIRRAEAVLADRDLSAEEKRAIARAVGIGAIKYADLSQTRTKEVVFDWDRMLALDGDSAPYLQYAYTRTRSILRKAAGSSGLESDGSQLTLPEEQAVLRQIARFPDAIAAAAETCEPHRIANRLYRLARDFSAFYDRVPVLKAETSELAAVRLKLVAMTGSVLKTGLGLLGIETPDRM
ncbi:arginine--tRNA ligase [candidate division WOR-3 bacterium]|nr:arginine--tRNA ligase [candidate division WOR-3 bacterium]